MGADPTDFGFLTRISRNKRLSRTHKTGLAVSYKSAGACDNLADTWAGFYPTTLDRQAFAFGRGHIE